MEQAIKQFREEFFFLSNFYECPVTYKQLTYTNNEAAFQAQKCTSDSEKIQFTKLNPSEAKKLGRKVNLRKDWESVKVKIMEEIVRAKFTQNTELADKLLATGDAYLEEGNAWGDRIWGTVNGSGANQLGIILMQIRADLINDARERARESGNVLETDSFMKGVLYGYSDEETEFNRTHYACKSSCSGDEEKRICNDNVSEVQYDPESDFGR